MGCCKLILLTISLVSLSNAVTVDYYQPPEHQSHVKYIQPAHANYVHHSEPVKYVHQPDHVKYVHQPDHVKYVHQPDHVKYVHQPDHVKYVHQPDHVKYVHQPEHVKYVHQPEHVKYIQKPHYEKHVDYDEPAQYEFGYTVHDDHTGDYKSHTEKRDGDTVHGRYEVVDPDGFKRIVEYTADDHHGFNAVVRREPTDIKIPQPEVKIVKKVYEPQPQHVKYYSPQPVQQKYYSPTVQPKYIVSQPAPIVKQVLSPQYYAPPEHPKYFKKQIYAEPQHTAIKYVQPAPHYTKDYHY